MILLYFSIFLFVWAVITYHNPELDHVAFVSLFIVLVSVKTFVDVYALPDLPIYLDGYDELSTLGLSEIPAYKLVTLKCPEIGFRYILRIGAFLGDFRWSLFIISVVHVLAYIKLAKRYSPYVIISLIIFLLGSVQSFFVLRQHLAIAITLFSYPFIINRDWKRFFLLMLLAFSFHLTAVVFIPVYFLYGINENRRMNLFLILIFVIANVLFLFIFSFFSTFFAGYEGYMDMDDGSIITVIVSACYFISYVFFLKKDVYLDGINRLTYILLALNLIIVSVGYSFMAVNRLVMYLSVVNIVSVPITMRYIKHPIIRYAFCASVLFILIYQFSSGSNAEYLNAI